MSVARSLFEQPAPGVKGPAGQWWLDLLMGPAAVTLCVLGVALLGFLMLSGQIAVRRGLKVVLGCFILLGAPTIASAFLETGGGLTGGPAREQIIMANEDLGARRPLPPANYDPYAGASLRRRNKR